MGDAFFNGALFVGVLGFLFLLVRLVQFRVWLRWNYSPTSIIVEGAIAIAAWVLLFITTVILDHKIGLGQYREPVLWSLSVLVAVVPWAGYFRIEHWLLRARGRRFLPGRRKQGGGYKLED